MGGAGRILILLSAPFHRHFPRLSTLSVRALSAFTCPAHGGIPIPHNPSRSRISLSIPASNLYTQFSSISELPASNRLCYTLFNHPWPEWQRLVDCLASKGYCDRTAPGMEHHDSFTISEELPEEFTKAARGCFIFARERPGMLRSLARRDIEMIVESGSPFLFKDGMNSARRMKSFLGSNGSNILASESACTVDVMRYLLSYAYDPLNIAGENNLQEKRLLEASIRNVMKELVNLSVTVQEPIFSNSASQHAHLKPQFSSPLGRNIEMKRGDWICPKCNFMNFARNMKCLECSEVRPKRQLTGGEWECPQCGYFNYGRNTSCLRCDCNRPVETSFNNTSGPRLVQNDKSSLSSSISQSLDRIFGCSSANQTAAGSISSKERFSSLEYRPIITNEKKDPGDVPFVPLPSDMFHKSQEADKETRKLSDTEYSTDKGEGQPNAAESECFEWEKADEALHFAKMKGTNHLEATNKSGSWFNKASEPQEGPRLMSGASDLDFPEISKSDHSFTSSSYKKRISMEQANDSNFVPFAPFPADYFTKKDKQAEDGPAAVSATGSSHQSASSDNAANLKPGMMNQSKFSYSNGTAVDRELKGGFTEQNSTRSCRFSGKDPSNSAIFDDVTRSPTGHSNNFSNYSNESWNSGTSMRTTNATPNTAVNSFQQPNNSQIQRESSDKGFSGKSLEGSAVTEPDPLDMSEEAKTQRWFRRVAQIKDISELANIPDEDFPEIMPMRKGVNRFVVSKRKTPLERRLASQQYRRNLPIISSEPEKDTKSE